MLDEKSFQYVKSVAAFSCCTKNTSFKPNLPIKKAFLSFQHRLVLMVRCKFAGGIATPVVYFLVDLLMDGEILKDLENTLIYDAMFFLPN